MALSMEKKSLLGFLFFANKKTQSVFVAKMQVNGVYFAKNSKNTPLNDSFAEKLGFWQFGKKNKG